MLDLKDVSVFTPTKIILSKLTLKVCKGDFVVVMGSSGTGKSTFLNLLAGFIPLSSDKFNWFGASKQRLKFKGQMFFNENDLTSVSPEKRNFGYISQHDSVFPHMSVHENIIFPLRCSNAPLEDRIKAANDLVELVKLGKDKLGQKASSLSGGEKQRLALAKLFAKNSHLALLDEPFAHLDPLMKIELVEILLKRREELDMTVVMVSHDWNDLKYANKLLLVLNHPEKQSGHSAFFKINENRLQLLSEVRDRQFESWEKIISEKLKSY